MKKIIFGRLNAYLVDNDITKSRQHGFRSNKGTTTAIATSHEIMANALAEGKQAVIVLRDVAKAFHKVWHNGLKYKLLRIGLPPLLEKVLCTFLDNRTARISIGCNLSNEIHLQSGVPQGSVISPTLYTLYTNDSPEAGPGTTDIMYADDVTQIITTESKSKRMMKLKVEREIERLNRFEKMWKIKTSEAKFHIIPIAQYKTLPITINNTNINANKEGKLLGLKLNTRGITSHASERIRKGKGILANLKRFNYLTPKLKATLIKTYCYQSLNIPPYHYVQYQYHKKIKLQRVINKGLRFIHSNEQEIYTIEELHLKYNITPFNVSTHNKAVKIWQTIQHTDPQLYLELTTPRDRKHSWFPRTSDILNVPSPLPIYTS